MDNNSSEEIKLKVLADILEKADIRKYTCVNGFGYSELERDIVSALSMSSVEAEGVSDELKKEYSQLIYLGKQSICKEKCHCHAECAKAEELSEKFEADFNRMLSLLAEKDEELKNCLKTLNAVSNQSDLKIVSLQSELEAVKRELEQNKNALGTWVEEHIKLKSQAEKVNALLKEVRSDSKSWKAGGIGGQDQYAGMPPFLRLIDEAIKLTVPTDIKK